MTTPIQTLCDCIKYCEEQNGMSLCKNCGLDKEIIDAALAESYRKGESAGLVEHCAEPECPECNIAAYNAGIKEALNRCKKVFQNHKEDHLCRFNDGEQNCDCYLSGINEVILALEETK